MKRKSPPLRSTTAPTIAREAVAHGRIQCTLAAVGPKDGKVWIETTTSRIRPNRLPFRCDRCAAPKWLKGLGKNIDLDQLRSATKFWAEIARQQGGIAGDEAREALLQLDPLWDELFPAEQARVLQLLVERVDVRMHGVEVRLRPNGLAGLVREVAGSRRAAA
jgi:hypothetical protein